MIPVPQGVYKRIDINNDKYKDYLNNEYIYLSRQSKEYLENMNSFEELLFKWFFIKIKNKGYL